MKKKRYCFNCGALIGVYVDSDPLDTCGMPECEKEARYQIRRANAEARAAAEEDDYDRYR